jgi:hypothetical protein
LWQCLQEKTCCPGDVAYNSSSAVCADIEVQTQGFHGLTCVGDTDVKTSGHAAILLNASNNTVNDVHVEAFWDGVDIGTVAGTIANVGVLNIDGSQNTTRGPVTNLVHICGGGASATCGTTGTVVKNISIFQAANNSPSGGKTSILDDTTGTVIGAVAGGDLDSVTGMYVLGDSLENSGGSIIGYSRFSTSPIAISTGSGAPPTAARCVQSIKHT